MNPEQIADWYYRNIDIKNRTIFFGPWQPSEEMVSEDKSWEVNDWSVQNAIKGLYLLEHMNKNVIEIDWLSYGGDVDAGMALYDYIKLIKSPIIMKCYGRVRSMGTIILQACKKRFLSPNCLFMIHYGTIGIDETHSKDAQATIQENARNNTIMEDIYLKKIRENHKRYTREKLSNKMKYDCFLTPKEAVDLGLADRVL